MGKAHKPRAGSMQFWPRKQARRVSARIRSWPTSQDSKLLGFAGYKVGMTHVLFTDNRKTSQTKGEDIYCPVTVIECPPIKAASLKFYKKTIKGLKLVSEVFSPNLDKELERKITLPKKVKSKIEDVKDYDLIRILVYTQPKLTGVGKKKPELFEVGLGGKKEDQLNYAKGILGKEISINDTFKEGQQLDFHIITKGKGFQGPVKRFGVSIRRHKSEKVKRGPGSLGGWKSQGHFMYRVAHAGRMGAHQRVEYNKWLLKIGDKPEEINPKKGFSFYGLVKNNYILVKGSIGGPAKKIVRILAPSRKNSIFPSEAPQIQYISLK